MRTQIKNPYLFARPVTSPLDSDEGITRDCSQRLPVRHVVELLDTSIPAAFPCDVGGEFLLACTPTVILPALLRNATSTELETYVAAEEAMTVCQLKQRRIIKAAGMRGKVWEDEETGEAFLHAQLDNSSYEIHRNFLVLRRLTNSIPIGPIPVKFIA